MPRRLTHEALVDRIIKYMDGRPNGSTIKEIARACKVSYQAARASLADPRFRRTGGMPPYTWHLVATHSDV